MNEPSDQNETAASGGSGDGTNAPEAISQITVSRGLSDWLVSNLTSFAFTSYQTGQLFLIGVTPDGAVSFNQQNFQRAMGLSYDDGRLFLGGYFQLWRLQNILRAGEIANEKFDMLLIPRNAQTIGDVDAHELGTDEEGRLIFVNSKYSCLATIDPVHSFKPVWRPPFVSKLVAEDRCHLNGLAMVDGRPRYVTAVSRSDAVNGWRERRTDGGVLVDVASGDVVCEGLSMPHSPRAHGSDIYLLDSGRGQLIKVDPASGNRTDIAFCPGFLRGMAIINGHALVTISKPRNRSFSGLALGEELEKRDSDPWCGVLIVNLASGDIVEWLRIEGHITELFDVVAMPGVRCPMSLGPGTIEIRNMISFEPILGESN